MKRMNTINIARELNDFLDNYDPYEYRDSIGEKELGLEQIITDLEQHQFQAIIDYLQEVIEENDTTDDNSKTALHLIYTIEEYRKTVE